MSRPSFTLVHFVIKDQLSVHIRFGLEKLVAYPTVRNFDKFRNTAPLS